MLLSLKLCTEQLHKSGKQPRMGCNLNTYLPENPCNIYQGIWTHAHTCSWCLTGRQLVSVAGRRKSTSSVWRTAWLCWRTRTKPSSRNSKPSKTYTATNPSSRQTPGGGLTEVRLSSCTETQHRAPPLFYYFAFFLKTAPKCVNRKKKAHIMFAVQKSVPISLPWRGEAVLKMDAEEKTQGLRGGTNS